MEKMLLGEISGSQAAEYEVGWQFSPDDGNTKHLQNVDQFLSDYTTLQSKSFSRV